MEAVAAFTLTARMGSWNRPSPGGRGVGQPLSERDRWIAAEVGPELARRGILFAGLDVIGDYLTEVNVTSPTCARELDAQFGLNIAGMVFDAIEATGPAGTGRP